VGLMSRLQEKSGRIKSRSKKKRGKREDGVRYGIPVRYLYSAHEIST